MKISIEPRSSDRAFLVVTCEHTPSGRCQWPLWQRPASGTMWQWDGNAEQPTIQPSFDCQGGCGRHFTITKGKAA